LFKICNRIQKQRKEFGLKISDNIVVIYNIPEIDSRLNIVCESFHEFIVKVIKVPFTKIKPEGYELNSTKEHEVGEDKKDGDKDSIGKEKFTISIYKKI
jgi:hypothetical protein